MSSPSIVGSVFMVSQSLAQGVLLICRGFIGTGQIAQFVIAEGENSFR
jgi:hypothetical protein